MIAGIPTSKLLTADGYAAIAEAVCRGAAASRIAVDVGVNRDTLRDWFDDPDFIPSVAKIVTPAKLTAEAVERLLAGTPSDGERRDATRRRRQLLDAMTELYPDWFADRDANIRSESRDAYLAAVEEAERQARAEAKAEAKRVECMRADVENLKTVCLLVERGWKDGTADELAKGLDTPEARRRHRCADGVTWDCAGFGSFFAPQWSATRCRLRYAEDDTGFDSVADDPAFDAAWREIERETDRDSGYAANPFARRDRRLPVTETAARELHRLVSGGMPFAEAAETVGRAAEKHARKETGK